MSVRLDGLSQAVEISPEAIETTDKAIDGAAALLITLSLTRSGRFQGSNPLHLALIRSVQSNQLILNRIGPCFRSIHARVQGGQLPLHPIKPVLEFTNAWVVRKHKLPQPFQLASVRIKGTDEIVNSLFGLFAHA